MIEWLDTLIQGILLGGFFALSGLGLSLSFGILRIVNIAHGDFLVVAAYLGVATVTTSGVGPLTAILMVVPAMGLLGYLLQRGLLNRAIGTSELTPLLITFGLSIILHNLLQEIASADYQSLDAGLVETASLALGPIQVGWLPVGILAAALAVYAALDLLMARTRFGRIVRATVDDPETTALMGVDTRRIYALGMALSMAIVGFSGMLYGIKSSFNPQAGGSQLLFAFEAVIIGGMGSIWGTLAGGMALGIAQTVGYKLHAGWGAFAGHVVFFAFLLLRPSGLFARGNGHG
ncbi:MAG: branched-chain amino acid ABC transporter permease [Rhodocyclaceae bacterium]|jgi:branched-chain amino acid transport system permease protein